MPALHFPISVSDGDTPDSGAIGNVGIFPVKCHPLPYVSLLLSDERVIPQNCATGVGRSQIHAREIVNREMTDAVLIPIRDYTKTDIGRAGHARDADEGSRKPMARWRGARSPCRADDSCKRSAASFDIRRSPLALWKAVLQHRYDPSDRLFRVLSAIDEVSVVSKLSQDLEETDYFLLRVERLV